MVQTEQFASVFDQIAPRCYVSVAQYFRTSPRQNTTEIAAFLRATVLDLIAIQPCLGGSLSEDADSFIRFHPRSSPTLNDVHIREIDCRHISFSDLEQRHYGPSYCCNSEFAVPPSGKPYLPVFQAAICWYQDGFALLTFLHHTVADGLSCQYVIEALAAVTCAKGDIPRQRQLRFGEPSWKKLDHRIAMTPAMTLAAAATEPQAAINFDKHCAYAAKDRSSGPLAYRGAPAAPSKLALLLVQVSTPGKPNPFCILAAQAWVLTMTARNRNGRFKRRYGVTSDDDEHGEEDEVMADMLFAVGLNRAEDELGSRAVYSKVSYPMARLLRALDDPAEVRRVEVHISKAVETARQPRFRRAYEETFETYFGEGGDPSRIQISADPADPHVFIFNTWRFMGKCGDRKSPIRWKFPCFGSPKPPDCIRKVAPGLGGCSYGLIQPSTSTCSDSRRTDEILITLQRTDAREFTTLVDEAGHAGIASFWKILDTVEEQD